MTVNQQNGFSDLFAELLFTEFVERVELLGEDEVLLKSAAGQLHTDDDGAVRDHHSYRAEVNLQILGQLLAARVAWILSRTFTITVDCTGIVWFQTDWEVFLADVT